LSIKILLFGANGQVGADCALAFSGANYNLICSSRTDTDFSNAEAVTKKVSSESPDIVINACAYTAVDKAEQERELADAINHKSVEALAKSCAQLSIPLIHLSTDYVFDGSGSTPYKETDAVKPLGAYGASKLAGEEVVSANLPEHIILRTSWVFGEQGNNFVKTMLRLGADRDSLNVVNDQFGRPSYVGDIVSTIRFFVDQFAKNNTLSWGIYHCSSEGAVSWFEFAQAIFEQAYQLGILAKPVKVNPIPSSEFPTPAPRPAYSVLDTAKLEQIINAPLPHWKLGLLQFLNAIKQH